MSNMMAIIIYFSTSNLNLDLYKLFIKFIYLFLFFFIINPTPFMKRMCFFDFLLMPLFFNFLICPPQS